MKNMGIQKMAKPTYHAKWNLMGFSGDLMGFHGILWDLECCLFCIDQTARNLKAMFPGNQAGGWLLILTTFQVVPIYMVIFVSRRQVFFSETGVASVPRDCHGTTFLKVDTNTNENCWYLEFS